MLEDTNNNKAWKGYLRGGKKKVGGEVGGVGGGEGGGVGAGGTWLPEMRQKRIEEIMIMNLVNNEVTKKFVLEDLTTQPIL